MAEKNNDLKPTSDTPAAAAAKLPSVDGTPAWVTGTMEFLKKYQNVFYAIATVVLLAWAVLTFQRRQKEAKIRNASTELQQAESVDALRGLQEKYKGLPIEAEIRFRIANKLSDEEKYDEAIKEYGEVKSKFPNTLWASLAGQREKAAADSKAWSGKDGMLAKRLEELRKQAAEETKAPTPGVGVKIDDAALPRVEVTLPTGKVVIELDEVGAPNATARVISLVERTWYTGSFVFKVEADAGVFFGDPMADGSAPRNSAIPFETSPLPASAGIVALVRDLPAEGQPDTDALKATASHKLVIFTGDGASKYKDKFLVVGRVVEGIENVRAAKEKDMVKEAKVLQKKSHPYLPKELPVEPPKEPGK